MGARTERPTGRPIIDFQDQDFDSAVHLTPTLADRQFWNRALDVALGDLAALVAPEQVVLCEGRPVSAGGKSTRSEFDARCYRVIFAEGYPTTDWISLGNSDDVRNDKLELGKSIQTIASGTKVIRVTDRDLLDDAEVREQQAAGVQVLNRRNIEAYLLDDEVLERYAQGNGVPGDGPALVAERDRLVHLSVTRGNDTDDWKTIAGEWYTFARKRYGLTGSGSNWEAFAVASLAPCIAGTAAYRELEQSIFV